MSRRWLAALGTVGALFSLALANPTWAKPPDLPLDLTGRFSPDGFGEFSLGESPNYYFHGELVLFGRPVFAVDLRVGSPEEGWGTLDAVSPCLFQVMGRALEAALGSASQSAPEAGEGDELQGVEQILTYPTALEDDPGGEVVEEIPMPRQEPGDFQPAPGETLGRGERTLSRKPSGKLAEACHLLQVGEACLRKGDLDMATNCFQEVYRLCPESSYGRKARARLEEFLTSVEEESAPDESPSGLEGGEDRILEELRNKAERLRQSSCPPTSGCPYQNPAHNNPESADEGPAGEPMPGPGVEGEDLEDLLDTTEFLESNLDETVQGGPGRGVEGCPFHHSPSRGLTLTSVIPGAVLNTEAEVIKLLEYRTQTRRAFHRGGLKSSGPVPHRTPTGFQARRGGGTTRKPFPAPLPSLLVDPLPRNLVIHQSEENH